MENKPHPDELGTLITIEERLDCLLNYYIENKTDNHTKWQIVSKKVGSLYLNELDLYLRENGFINKRDDRPFTSVTVKGELFKGFAKEKRKETISISLQLASTWAIVIGTFGLFVWEMIKYFFLEKHDSVNYYFQLF